VGEIKHMLGRRNICPHENYKHFCLEAAENIHFHWRDTRLQLLPEDFDGLHDCIVKAHKQWVDDGKPIQDDKNIPLGGGPVECAEIGFNHGLLTMEEQVDGSIHIHWRDTRIHVDHIQFTSFAMMTREAQLAFLDIHKELVVFDTLEHPAISDIYMEWIKEYIDSGNKVNPDSCIELCMKKNKLIAEDKPANDELEKQVVFSIYESIKKYGYAIGPFYGEYAICWELEDGKKYMAAAHRWAALKTLGYKNILVCTVPEIGSKLRNGS